MSNLKKYVRREEGFVVPSKAYPYQQYSHHQQRYLHSIGNINSNHYNYHYNQQTANQHSQSEYQGTFPRISSKEIVCGSCKRRFYIGKDLKGQNSPLLLPCGHGTCAKCEIARPNKPCPLCPDKYKDAVKRERLLYNTYIVGLIHVIKSSPVHIDDPDLVFHFPKKISNRKFYDQVFCNQCSTTAHYDCKNCQIKFCLFCFKRIHKEAFEGHDVICLNQNAVKLLSTMLCPDHEDEACDYYCEDCDIECCSHCLIRLHKEHKTMLQDERNQDFIPDYLDALQKLKETKFYTSQTLKNFRSKLPYIEAIEKSKKLEADVTQKFIYLHGYLQNLEHRLKSELVEYREKIDKNTEDLEEELVHLEDELTSAYVAFSSAEKNSKRINMKKFTEKMSDLADSPCHFVGYEETDGELSMTIDDDILNKLDELVHLELPEIPKPHLIMTDDLPEGYELDTIPDDDTTNMSFRTGGKGDTSSAALSSTSMNQSMNESAIEEMDAHSITQSASVLISDSMENVTISHVINPNSFYVVKNSLRMIREKVESSIAEHVDKDDLEVPSEVELNKIYVVNYLETNQWYRGRIVKEEKNETYDRMEYEVFYVDYGITDKNVQIERIRVALQEFVEYCGAAIQCELTDVVPIEDEWYDDKIDQFKQMIRGEEFSMKVKSVNQNIHAVDLIKVKNNPNNLSLNEWLVHTKKAPIVSTHKLKRMNPQSSKCFYYEQLADNKSTIVHISYIESPHCIYVHKDDITYFNEKIDKLSLEYKNFLATTERPIKTPELGNPVAVYTPLGKFHRGLIKKINSDEEKVEVHLVDYGSSVLADYNSVYHLPGRFCKTSVLAIKVSLLHVKPVEDDWSTECLNYMKKKLEDRSSVKVIPYSLENGVYNVAMYVKDISVASNLVAKNFAISTGDLSKNPNMNQKLPPPKKSKKHKIPKINLEFASKEKEVIKQPVEESDPFKTRVNITKIISPEEIYASLNSNIGKFEEMNQRMQKFYQTHVANNWVRDLQPNGIYCCWSVKDQAYCRAEFLDYSENDANMVVMALVDLGEIEEIPLNDVQPLESEFIRLPKNTFKMKLGGIRPCGGTDTWQSTSCQKLKDIIHDEGDSKYYVTLVDSYMEDKTFLVNLSIRRNVLTTGPLEPVRKETVIVARRLIEEGVALPIKGFFDNDKKEPAIELQKKLKLHGINTESHENSFEKRKTPSVSPTSDLHVIEEIEENQISEEEEEVIGGENLTKEMSLDDSNESMPLPKYADWLPAAYLREDTFDAVITYVDNDGDVYFYPNTKEYNDRRTYISDTLKEIYSKKSCKQYDFKWEVNDLCIAKFHATNSWCRGKITEVIDDQTVKVLFVDWGNIEDCSIGTVKKRIVLDKIPIQITTASIEGVSPINYHWSTNDLDILHKLLVFQPCRLKVIEKPPQSWRVAIWVNTGSSFVNLPWYIRNKTQVECNVDITNYSEDEPNCALKFIESSESPEPTEPTEFTKLTETTELGMATNEIEVKRNTSDIIITVSSDESGDSNNESLVSSDDGNTEYGTADADSAANNSRDDSVTLRDEDEFLSIETNMGEMHLMSYNESLENTKIVSNSTSSLASSGSNDMRLKSSSPNQEESCTSPEYDANESGNSYDNEEMISGNSVLFSLNCDDVEFDMESVKTENLKKNDSQELISSTPLNISITSNGTNDMDKLIDFQKYNVKCFDLGMGQAFSEVNMSGYLRDTDNWDLKQWLDKSHQVHECIQSCVEEQPIFIPETGDYCIAQFNDGMWYRAIAEKKVISNERPATVANFIDYGNRLVINDDENCIRTIRPEWLEVPWMSFKFKLFNVKVAPERKMEASKSINDVFGQSNRYWVQIKNYEPELELEIFLNKKTKRLVYASLIEEGILEKIDPKI